MRLAKYLYNSVDKSVILCKAHKRKIGRTLTFRVHNCPLSLDSDILSFMGAILKLPHTFYGRTSSLNYSSRPSTYVPHFSDIYVASAHESFW